jgi:hypothetical protein
MMEAVRTSETSVDNHFTRQYIPEDNSEQVNDRYNTGPSVSQFLVSPLSSVSLSDMRIELQRALAFFVVYPALYLHIRFSLHSSLV